MAKGWDKAAEKREATQRSQESTKRLAETDQG
jgi:hypothetical protein